MYSNTVFKQPLEVSVYSCHFSREIQREHAEEVARCSSEVFL